ncbi:MAG: DNA-binding domain-containing protein [Sulfuricellaceae bacterium]
MDSNAPPHSPDLATTQSWMMAAISAPRGLPEGLARAQKAYGWEIEDVIVAPPGISPHKRLDIYAQGYWLRLFACLKADYPTLQRLLGEPLFEFFARAYLTNHPSRSFSLYDLGNGFAQFLKQSQSASAKAADNGALNFPLDLALIEQAIAASLRATGLEGATWQTVDPHDLLLGGNVEVQLPATTRLLMANHPLSVFLQWFDGNDPSGQAESRPSYICVKRRHFRVSCQELSDWQYHFLLSAQDTARPLIDCANNAARQTQRPVHEILALLAFWLPAAQSESMLELRRNAAENPDGADEKQ